MEQYSSSPSSSSPSSPKQAQRKQWLEQSILRRLIEPVKSTVEAIRSVSPILLHQTPDDCAVFARHELLLNYIPVGNGGFSTVHEIIGINLDATIHHERCNTVQRMLREKMAQNLHDTNGRPRYVLKHLMRKLLNHPKSFQDALRDLALEVEYMSRISHEFILPLVARPLDGLDAAVSSYDGFFLITERLDTTLFHQIKEWNVNSENAVPTVDQRSVYMEQLAAALAYLHERRIVFRDLKPQNIGLYQNSIRLFDFGLCRELPPASSTNVGETFEMSGVGTQRYMAVELVNNCPYNCKVDVYSWALVSWEIMTGVRPYYRYGDVQHKMAVIHQDERPMLSTEWPRWLQTVLTSSWCRDIDQRNSMAMAVSMLQSRHHVAAAAVRPETLVVATTIRQSKPAATATSTTTTFAVPSTYSGKMFLRERSFGQVLLSNVEQQQQRHALRLSSVHWNMGLVFAK